MRSPLLLRLLFLACLLALLGACGGSAANTTSATPNDDDEEDEDGYVDEEPEEPEGEGSDFIDATLLRGAQEPMQLADAAVVPGTGVTMRPPSGSRPMPFGAGFLAMQHRVQFSVVVAEGDASVVEAMRTGGAPDAPEPDDVDPVTVSGQAGRLGRDRVSSPSGSLERMWLLVHDGTRGMGVVATYEAERSRTLRPGVRAVLESVEWDPAADLDAALALGIEVGDVQGLVRSRRSSANVLFMQRGGTFPPEAGQPVFTVSPLPMQIPEAQQDEACTQLLARFVPAAEDDVALEGEIEGGPLPGCERMATAETRDEERVIAYAALLFHGGLPILVTASADAAELATWRPRFVAATRSVRPREDVAAP